MVDERVLINKCRRDVPSAQKKLYTNYRTHWFMICLRYSNRREDAMDILQNALVNIFMKIEQFDDKIGTFKSWSSKIVVNESIMYSRKQLKYRSTEELNNDIYIETKEGSPIESLSVNDLTKMIQTLPDGYRLVFNMYAIEGYTHREIGDILGIKEGTSKSQYFKAKNMLRKRVEEII